MKGHFSPQTLAAELDRLILHARADALVATGSSERVVTDPIAREHHRIGFAAGRLTALEDVLTLVLEQAA